MLTVRIQKNLNANTLSGQFMQRLSRMPMVDDRVADSGYLMTVISLHDQRVGRVSIEKHEKNPGGTEQGAAPWGK